MEVVLGKETVLFKTEEKMNAQKAADLLRKIADKIEKGRLVLQRDKKTVTLAIPNNLEVEVKAERETGKKKTKEKIEVEIEWVEGEKRKRSGTLTIG
jgi:amphi-Trp domain-containing protein